MNQPDWLPSSSPSLAQTSLSLLVPVTKAHGVYTASLTTTAPIPASKVTFPLASASEEICLPLHTQKPHSDYRFQTSDRKNKTKDCSQAEGQLLE